MKTITNCQKIGIMAAFLFLLAGCGPVTRVPGIGDMLPGKMYSLKDGTEFVFAVQISYGSGSMTASNPTTGESFTGQYTGVSTGGGVSETTSSALFSTNKVTTTTVPTGAICKGILKGDKGTIITMTINVQTGKPPKGFGDGEDNYGVKYQFQF